jgi:Protein of unknown function (DUF3365)
MRCSLFVALAVCALAGPAVAIEPNPAQVKQARTAAKGLGDGLKAQLMAAIKAGGTMSAIAVCRTIAPELAAQLSQKSGLSVGRTALRLRNPANAPDDWERAVLQSFAARIAAGADPKTLEHAENVMDAAGATTFRYMKAIPMGKTPCLACHGVPEPAVKAEITRLYPQDQATGFKPGELRGAFTVKGPAR